MPYRKTPLISEEIYHLCNRSVAKVPVFQNKYDYLRAMELIDFYRFINTQIRFSHYNRLDFKKKSDFIYTLYSNKTLVDIYAFCLMPNHFHLLVKQNVDGGVAKFMRIFQNSYAKYLNIKTKRAGAVWQSMFKAVRIESQEQLLHVFRYINLNPVTSYIIKDFKDLINYRWCSYSDYLLNKPLNPFLDTKTINSYFKTTDKLISFLENQVNYQRTLNQIKHLMLEE
ncbi:MAG: transposase [Patescibacteria group bacterium]